MSVNRFSSFVVCFGNNTTRQYLFPMLKNTAKEHASLQASDTVLFRLHMLHNTL